MAERGATPQVPVWRRKALHAARHLFTPLLPDDYLELINPLWSTRELRGRVEAVERETDEAVTIVIKPGWEWEGHEPGQYVRIGFRVDGVHHWRAYSLTSDPGRPDGCISITSKLLESPLFHVISGNLGYQVEHHLFPDMPSTRYGEIAPQVREICQRYDLPYNTGPLGKQWGGVMRTIARLAFPGGRPRPKPGPYRGAKVRSEGEGPPAEAVAAAA